MGCQRVTFRSTTSGPKGSRVGPLFGVSLGSPNRPCYQAAPARSPVLSVHLRAQRTQWAERPAPFVSETVMPKSPLALVKERFLNKEGNSGRGCQGAHHR